MPVPAFQSSRSRPPSPYQGRVPAPVTQMGPSAGSFAMPPRTMLLVEDSRFAAEAVRLICRRAGIRLRRADSLANAALHLRVYRPDIALIDLGLPDGSGLDLIAALHRSHVRPRRMVAISGDLSLRDAALQAGADAFLLKPISLTRHLAVMTGEAADTGDTERDWEAEWDEYCDSIAERNAGADPMALRDDLRLVHDLLQGAPEPGKVAYAGQFLASVGHAMHDPALAEAARAASEAGDRHSLAALVEAKKRRTADLKTAI
ncbi:response regulator [Pararhodobacter sp. CCB-MM2]|uniref:response regulator n=1 Tax=Pararhodobacter sp. CCB-MM2 TaxID=1786003 RepID=UPI001314DDFE|nr:response regulator [Pararhodobacter sp. CCB-MM2]